MFGSDFPFAPAETCEVMTGGWEKFAEGLGPEERWLVERGCAEGLFPRLKGGGKGVNGVGDGEGKVKGVVEHKGEVNGVEHERKVNGVEHEGTVNGA